MKNETLVPDYVNDLLNDKENCHLTIESVIRRLEDLHQEQFIIERQINLFSIIKSELEK